MLIDNRVTGRTKVLGLIGNPVEHSLSPQLHNTILGILKLDYVYIPMKVEKSELESAVKGIKALNFKGFNITAPHKKHIMEYLDEVSKEALLIGAVNTVKNTDGRLVGYNTDGEGFLRSFKEEAGVGFQDKKILIIGAGGAARSIAVKIAMEGAKAITIVNRTPENAREIADVINNNIKAIVQCCSSQTCKMQDIVGESDYIINTTSIGMHPDVGFSPLDSQIKFDSNQVVYDAIYSPLKTKLLLAAEKSGCKIVNGLGMLFYQGINALEIWMGLKFSDELVMNVYDSFKEISK